MTTGTKLLSDVAERKQEPLACPGEAKRFITRSRTLVGWWEFSARLLRYFERRWVADSKSSR